MWLGMAFFQLHLGPHLAANDSLVVDRKGAFLIDQSSGKTEVPPIQNSVFWMKVA